MRMTKLDKMKGKLVSGPWLRPKSKSELGKDSRRPYADVNGQKYLYLCSVNVHYAVSLWKSYLRQEARKKNGKFCSSFRNAYQSIM